MHWIDALVVLLVLAMLCFFWYGRKKYNDASAELDQGDYLREIFNHKIDNK